MSHLKSLTFCVTPQQVAENPRLVRRQRLIEKLEQQQRLAKDQDFVVVVKRSSKDADGNRVVTERTKKIRPWWRTDEHGNVVLTVRSGFRILELEKGKPGIVVGSIDKLDGVLTTLVSAAKAGELDPMLEQAKTARSAPRKKAA